MEMDKINIIDKWDNIYRRYSFMINISICIVLQVFLMILFGDSFEYGVFRFLISFILSFFLYVVLTIISYKYYGKGEE